MKIISWNVNGIRAVEKKGFVDWILKCGADVVCIQETKANPGQLSLQLINPGADSDGNGAVYRSYFSSAKRPGYSGTAIYSKTEPDSVEIMGDERFDDEGRVTIAKFNTDKKDKKIAVISAYFPNSQDAGARLDYKLAFCDAMLKKCDALVKEGFNIVLCGDYNIAHKPIDLANPKANEGNAGYLPEERAWMDTFTNAGYVDTFRHFCEEPKQYTWWSYRFHAREKNIGWRIDYQCVNHDFIENVKSSVIMSDVTGSDHCPIMVEVEE
ncbi:MAG: exodeoxyribonuclease III [Treponema sp.]|uniref:exodeoxyribonuclease III n=1 Tax=Treponema sp. TaxID=166 RepID=UPI00298D85F7|nr:exodeoxyribonuclease III [Treponema sp.]MCR5386818.1 exodeoxyribonuclease III [Treponema sp.]